MLRCVLAVFLTLTVAFPAPAADPTARPAGRGAPPSAPLKLHVPSPDWRDQVIYFVVTDRFADGDPRNNDFGAGEFKAGDRTRFNGGDLAGLRQRLDYIQGLGATALWVTPPVANQWLDPSGSYTGYHGYWAEHFKRVDRHLGTLQDYRLLSDALHRRGMYLVQDVVVNHTGNFFTYRDRWRRGDPAHGWEAHDRSAPVPRPSQPPFHLNDPRDPAQRRAGIYHWTPDIADFTDPEQEATFQMSGLDDLNTGNPAVRRALRDSFGFWIREVGVDALRVDTAFYVPPEFFPDFLDARDPKAPGVREVARRTGRRDLHVFGEGFAMDRAFDDAQMRKIERYMTGPDGRPRLPGMIHFPLYGTLGDVFARGRPTAELAHRIQATMRLHPRAHWMPTFVDNHDVDRFLAGGSPAALRQALLALFTLPGIPVVYYGTEQGFTQPRASMFAAGWGSGGRDRYDTASPLYRHLAALAALRREHRLFSRGTPTMLKDEPAGPGAVAWRMDHVGRSAIVAMNTAERPALADAVATGLAEGTRLKPVFTLDGKAAPTLVVGPGGRVDLTLGARAGAVWVVESTPGLVPTAGAAPAIPPVPGREPAASAAVTLDGPAETAVEGDFTVGGRAAPGAALQVVVDGDLATARRVIAGSDGRWTARVDASAMVDPSVRHRVVLVAADAGAGAGTSGTGTGTLTANRPDDATGPAVQPLSASAVSSAQTFRVTPRWTLRADVEDPAGDDHGPTGRYRYPTDPSWGENRQMDLRRVRLWTAGGALRLDLTMRGLTTTWNPAHGFDHVAFTVFVELPGQPGGVTAMPGQNASLPGGMRWHRRLRVHGWTNALFGPEGASATADGMTLAPAARIEADRATRTVSLQLSAASLGRLPSLDGARVYVTTWDYDGGYRALQPEAGGYSMGGGDGAREPLVMDDLPPIEIR